MRQSHTSLRRVVAESFRLFDPRRMIRHPVMFTVYVLFLFVLVYTVIPGWFPDIARGYDPLYSFAIVVILFLTLWFANLSEAIAEARGKAQADSLREIKTGVQARQVLPDGRVQWAPADSLRIGDLYQVSAGETVPIDGDVVQGAAQIDESMMTGESEPVLRESGGDKTSVLGGTKVVQGTVRVRVTAAVGQTFIDQLIRLVEGANRSKTPNELALDVILASLTIAFLIVIVSFLFLAEFFAFLSPAVVNIGTLIALLVCLMPTTIGALLPAIGISGLNRVAKANVIAKSGKAVEAAGDLDVLILDKTGTITVGNRLAVQFVAAPGVEMAELLEGALIASSLDDTSEGRSILRLATRRGATAPKLEPGSFRVVPFTPERKMSGIVLNDGREFYKGAVSAVAAQVGSVPDAVTEAAAAASRQGMTPLALIVGKRVLGIVVLKDVIKPGIRDRIHELRTMGIRTIMATGDNRLTAAAIARESGVDEFLAEVRPQTKLAVIEREKAAGRLVAMSGDGTNDAPALAQADVGLAMNSGTGAAKEAGNMVDLDNDPTKLIEIVSIGKQLLITRGGLTTFSITNDVAKYFAIIPAIFVTAAGVAVGGVGLLNIMALTSPKLAILSTLLFNALIIPFLIPLALGGVWFRPRNAIDLLRRNLMIYGLGGLLSAFVGIKLLYLALQYLSATSWLTPVYQFLLAHLPGVLL
ncbi:MAG TPA: potassium-transporting ATPase subunit KdpB [Thermoplasmata archaeon]|nr:potassium-transporting ATPase subunit KdpB [Thermoplasmata archaeon]